MYFLFCIGLNAVLPAWCSGKVADNGPSTPHSGSLLHTLVQGLCLDYCKWLKNLSLKLQHIFQTCCPWSTQMELSKAWLQPWRPSLNSISTPHFPLWLQTHRSSPCVPAKQNFPVTTFPCAWGKLLLLLPQPPQPWPLQFFTGSLSWPVWAKSPSKWFT